MDDTHTRRRLLATASGLTAATLAGCLGSSDNGNDETDDAGTTGDGPGADGTGENTQSNAQSWPMFGVDVRNTGHHPETTGPEDGIEKAWTADVDGSPRGPPVISDSTVFVRSRNGSFYAADADTGEIEWDVEFPGTGTPTVVDDTVYATSRDDLVAAFDVETGDQHWSQTEDVSMSPLVVDGSLYVGGYQYGTQDGRDVGTNPIYQYDTETGERDVLREYPYDEDSAGFPEAFALGDDALIFNSGETVRSVELSTGEQQWVFESIGEGDLNKGSPVLVDGTVYATDVTNHGDPYLYAIDAETGDEQWRFQKDEMTRIEAGPSVADGAVYLPHHKSISALDADSGEELWTQQIRGRMGGVVAKLTIVDGVIYANCGAWLTAIDASTGEVLWDDELDDGIHDSQLVVLDGIIYAVRSREDTIVAFEAI